MSSASSRLSWLGSLARLSRPTFVFASSKRAWNTHPDVSVICGSLERDPDDHNTATNPVVIVEVLSPSTQRYDREEKAAHYRRITSLASYVLISQEEQRLEVFSRNGDGSWTLREARSGAVDLPTIGCRLSVEDVYRNPLGG
jgi:Uma2 family endonuclease